MKEAAPDKLADAWYAGHDQDDNNQYYASNYDEEVFINFYGIESVCSNSHQSFPSKSLLHKYLKTTYSPGNLGYSQTPTSSLTSVPVQISKATLDSIGSGLAFRGWSYAIASVILSPHTVQLQSDSAASCCLDTGCGVTLVDRQ